MLDDFVHIKYIHCYLLSTEGQQQLPTQRVATNVLADDKKVQAKVAKKLAKQQVGVTSIVYL